MIAARDRGVTGRRPSARSTPTVAMSRGGCELCGAGAEAIEVWACRIRPFSAGSSTGPFGHFSPDAGYADRGESLVTDFFSSLLPVPVREHKKRRKPGLCAYLTGSRARQVDASFRPAGPSVVTGALIKQSIPTLRWPWRAGDQGRIAQRILRHAGLTRLTRESGAH